MFHCSVINVPRGLAPASAATLIGYQTQKPLSTTFLFYYQSFLFSAPLFCGAEDILALTDPFGKHYFIIFQLIILYLSGRRPTLLFQRRPSIGRQDNIMLRQSILAEQRMRQCRKKLNSSSTGSHVSSHLTIPAESPV